jgi:hypothetical protein
MAKKDMRMRSIQERSRTRSRTRLGRAWPAAVLSLGLGLVVVVVGSQDLSAAAPPWVKCQKPPIIIAGDWGYRPDWRTEQWHEDEWGFGLHRKTQAFSLAWEEKKWKWFGHGCDACEPGRQLEYFPKRPFLPRH